MEWNISNWINWIYSSSRKYEIIQDINSNKDNLSQVRLKDIFNEYSDDLAQFL